MSSGNFPVPAFPCGERYAVRASKLFTMAKRCFMMEREQCGVRCHLRGFDTGFFAETGCTGEVTTKKMNVLMLNGSPNPNVNTSIVLREMENVFRENGVESETVFAATGIFTAASAALRPENASLPTSRTSLSRNSRRRKHCLRSVRHSARQGAVRSVGAGGMDADPLHPPR